MGFSGVSIDTVKPREYVSPIDVASFERTVEHNIANEDKQAALVAGVAGQAIGRYKQDIDNLLSNYSSLTGSNSISKISNFMSNPEVKQVMNGIIDSTTLANEIQKYQDTGNAIPLDLQAEYKPYSDYLNGRTSERPKDRPTYSAPFLDYNKSIKDIVATIPEENYTLQPGEYGNNTGKPLEVVGKDPRKIETAIKNSGLNDFVYRQQSALARNNGNNQPDNEVLSQLKYNEAVAKKTKDLQDAGATPDVIANEVSKIQVPVIPASPFVADELSNKYMDAEAKRWASLYMSTKKEGHDVGASEALANKLAIAEMNNQTKLQTAGAKIQASLAAAQMRIAAGGGDARIASNLAVKSIDEARREIGLTIDQAKAGDKIAQQAAKAMFRNYVPGQPISQAEIDSYVDRRSDEIFDSYTKKITGSKPSVNTPATTSQNNEPKEKPKRKLY